MAIKREGTEDGALVVQRPVTPFLRDRIAETLWSHRQHIYDLLALERYSAAGGNGPVADFNGLRNQ